MVAEAGGPDALRKKRDAEYTYRYRRAGTGAVDLSVERYLFDDEDYHLVKLSFDVGVGDVSDTYVLYINPRTWRVDQFLFTVLDFAKTDPFLMKVECERVDGILLPVKRRYTASDWSGTVSKNAESTDEVSVGIRFDNGFGTALFAPPKR